MSQQRKNSLDEELFTVGYKRDKTQSGFGSRNLTVLWNGEKGAHTLFRQKYNQLPLCSKLFKLQLLSCQSLKWEDQSDKIQTYTVRSPHEAFTVNAENW